MASVPDVVGLLHRADWTRLSLTAEVNTGIDPRSELEEHTGGHAIVAGGHAIVAAQGYARAGRSGRLQVTAPETADRRGTALPRRTRGLRVVSGCDGERRWDQHGPGQPGGQDPAEMSGDPEAPLWALLCPAPLLTGFILDVRGPVTACGRDAMHVVATPRQSMHDLTGRRHRELDCIEAIVDTELGILLSRQEFFEDQIVRLSQLASVTLNPPEAADDSRFRAPPGSVIRKSTQEKQREFYDQPSGRRMAWRPAASARG